MIRRLIVGTLVLFSSAASLRAEQPFVDGLIPKAQQAMKIDGALEDWAGAFVTPLNAHHPDFADRGALVYYLWDEQALYIGLRAQDTKPAHVASDRALYDGDAIEFYLDTREGAGLRNPEFQPRTLHMFFTALTGRELKPRYAVRELPVFKDLKLQGVELAAAKTADGYTLEFKLPWSNFPGFTPKASTQLGIDVELCSSDGGRRVFRTFTYSSPQSVQTPSAFGRVVLVDKLDTKVTGLIHLSRALMPVDLQMPGNYGWLHAHASLSPTVAGQVRLIRAQLMDQDRKPVKTVETTHLKRVAGHWTFARCDIETFDLPPGTYEMVIFAFSPDGGVVVGRRLKVLLPP